MKVLLLLFVGASVLETNARRKMQSADRLLHSINRGPEMDAFGAPSDGNVTLQILAANFWLGWQLGDFRECAESRGMARSTRKKCVGDRFERVSPSRGEAHANGVDTIVRHNRRCRRLAFNDCGSIGRNFLGCEAGAGSHPRADLEIYR